MWGTAVGLDQDRHTRPKLDLSHSLVRWVWILASGTANAELTGAKVKQTEQLGCVLPTALGTENGSGPPSVVETGGFPRRVSGLSL